MGDEAKTFILDAGKWKPAPKGFRYSNLVGKWSTKRGKLYTHTTSGWLVYVDPEHEYRINSKAQVVRAARGAK